MSLKDTADTVSLHDVIYPSQKPTALDFHCSCGAIPGDPCTDSSGNRYPYTHTTRSLKATKAQQERKAMTDTTTDPADWVVLYQVNNRVLGSWTTPATTDANGALTRFEQTFQEVEIEPIGIGRQGGIFYEVEPTRHWKATARSLTDIPF